MLKSEVLAHYGTPKAIAEALGITIQAVWQWGEQVPPLRARQIDVLTHGALKFDPAPYAGSNSERLAKALSTPRSAAT